jgi:metallo-beta-lactamase family protein
LAWHGHIGAPQRTFLVHGENGAMRQFATRLTQTAIEMPKLHQEFEL